MNRELPVKRENEFNYRICFHQGFEALKHELEKDNIRFYRACIVTDSSVGPLYAQAVSDVLKSCCEKVCIHTFPAGEENKHLDTVQNVYTYLIEEGFDRGDMIFALGGGVPGDLSGFAAATYLRGIRFIQIPTSLLAQVDSSIGGKTGVDFRKYKNMVGAFHQPSLVYMNTDVLSTLNEEQFACGMAEIIKAGMLADAGFFQWLSDKHSLIMAKDRDTLEEMILRSCRIKRDIVEEDPKEQGVRALLNLGHTIGHAVEKLMDFSMLHGQCVALGYVAAAYLSLQRGLISTQDLFAVERLNRLYGLSNRIDGLEREAILKATKKDKKMSHGTIKFVLLKSIGNAVTDTTVSEGELLSAIDYIIEEKSEKNNG